MMELRDKLLGSWRLVEAEGLEDESSTGLLIYDVSGTMSVHLMRADRPRFKSDDWREATPDEKSKAWSGYFGYFGSFAVDETANTVIHYVEGGSFPNWVGTQQLRRCSLEGNRLTLTADSPSGTV